MNAALDSRAGNRPHQRAARIRLLILWLFVIFTGITLGAGLYELRIMVPQWLTVDAAGQPFWDAAAAREANTGVRFWVFVTTGPLTILTIASAIAAWFSPAPLRRWWLIAVGVCFADRVLTFGFFIPAMVALMSADPPLPQAEAVPLATLWADLDLVRQVLSLGVFLAALKALTVAASIPAPRPAA